MIFFRSIHFLARLCLVAFLATCGIGISQEQIIRHNYTDHKDTFVEVQSVFGAAARQGSIPFKLKIRNNSGKDRTWSVVLREGNQGRSLRTRVDHTIEVKNGSEILQNLYLPVAPAFLAYDYRNLSVSITATGLPVATRSHGGQTNREFPTLAISKPLALRSLAKLDDLVKTADSSNPSFAKPFEAGDLPKDWIGYTSLDGLLIDLDSWNSLSAAVRQAILAWVRLGGRVDLYTDQKIGFADLKFPLPSKTGEEKSVRLSLGEFHIREWDGRELSGNVVQSYQNLPQRERALEQDFEDQWLMKEEFGEREFNGVLIFLFLSGFAILVAPVNLFYFAKPGQRHRLFYTTPLISVGTCLIIVVFIFLIDGIGGRGTRAVLADLQPAAGEMRLYLSQEQISRTGVMVNAGFNTETTYDLSPVNMSSGSFDPFSSSSRLSTEFEFSPGENKGGFFSSRSEQGFSIRAAEPTRARIELRSTGETAAPPVLVSNLSETIEDFAYIDEEGTIWVTPTGVKTQSGSQIPIQSLPGGAWPEWIKDELSLFSESLQKQAKSLRSDRNRFFARVQPIDSMALPTHPGIRWESTRVLLTGTPLDRSSAPSIDE